VLSFLHSPKTIRITRRRLAGCGAAALCVGLAIAGVEAGGAAAPAAAGTAQLTASQLAAHNPRGSFAVSAHGRYVHVRGVANDPDSSRSVPVVLYVGSRPVRHITAWRPGHVYDATIATSWGWHAIGARALNIGTGTGNPALGARFVHLVNPATRNPRGHITTRRTGTLLTIHGVATDPDVPHGWLRLYVWRNGHLAAVAHTAARNHRFFKQIRLGYGRNRVGVIASNRGLGTRSPRIGLRVMTLSRSWTTHYHGAQRIAAQMFAHFGWGAAQMPALVKLWNRESNWRTSAMNPSGAYGIPQALPGGKMASAGPDWRTSATTQIRWGLRYIAGRYGSPNAAWAHSCATSWY
jgi:hypothetical protein